MSKSSFRRLITEALANLSIRQQLKTIEASSFYIWVFQRFGNCDNFKTRPVLGLLIDFCPIKSSIDWWKLSYSKNNGTHYILKRTLVWKCLNRSRRKNFLKDSKVASSNFLDPITENYSRWTLCFWLESWRTWSFILFFALVFIFLNVVIKYSIHFLYKISRSIFCKANHVEGLKIGEFQAHTFRSK